MDKIALESLLENIADSPATISPTVTGEAARSALSRLTELEAALAKAQGQVGRLLRLFPTQNQVEDAVSGLFNQIQQENDDAKRTP